MTTKTKWVPDQYPPELEEPRRRDKYRLGDIDACVAEIKRCRANYRRQVSRLTSDSDLRVRPEFWAQAERDARRKLSLILGIRV